MVAHKVGVIWQKEMICGNPDCGRTHEYRGDDLVLYVGWPIRRPIDPAQASWRIYASRQFEARMVGCARGGERGKWRESTRGRSGEPSGRQDGPPRLTDVSEARRTGSSGHSPCPGA